MMVHIDVQRVGNFLYRHREAVVVIAIALVAGHKNARRIDSMEKFITSKGLGAEYNCTHK